MSTTRHSLADGEKRVILHIGAPKTGTTYLQQILFDNAAALARDGALYPYEDVGQSFRSAHDFCGSSWFGFPADRFRGEWDRVAERVREWSGRTIIVSSELLAGAPRRRIAKGLAKLGPAELHVVFSARDLARQLVSDWQEQVKHGHTVPLERFVEDLVTLGRNAPKPFGKLFWGMHDAPRVLEPWAKLVPTGQIHVLTVPQDDGPRDALWRRFCAIAGLDPAGYDTRPKRTNTSMGVVETELIRRMNQGVKTMDVKSYDALVRLFLAEKVLGRGSEKLTLPPQYLDWAKTRSRQMIDAIEAAGYAVEGDLQDLMPVEPGHEYVSPTELTDGELGPTAIKAATALLSRAGRLRDQNAALQAARQGVSVVVDDNGAGTLAGVSRRAARRLLRKG